MATANSLKSLNKDNPDVSKSDLFKISPHLLTEEEGLNARGAFCEDYWSREDVQARIESIKNAYLRGDYVPPILVKVVDDKVVILDGAHRWRAMLKAIEEGAEIVKTEVLEFRGDEAEQAALLATANDGRPYTPLERAVVYGRLKNWGWSVTAIADKFGRTASNISGSLELLDLPMEIKQMIQSEKVAATYALELYREHGTKAIDIIKNAEQKAHSQGKSKVTKKVAKPKIDKKVVDQTLQSVASIADRLDDIEPVQGPDTENPSYVLTLTEEEVQALKQYRESAEQQRRALEEFEQTPSESDDTQTEE